MTVDQAEELEIWELQTPGRVSMEVKGEYGNPRRITAKGQGSRLRLTAHDRRIVQEKIRYPQNDPFKNGKMVRINRADEEARAAAAAEGRTISEDPPAPDEMNDEQLNSIFLLEGDEFQATVKGLSEFNVRRLKKNATTFDASLSQIAFLNDYIEETWPVTSGSTPSYDELQARPISAV